MPVYPFRCLLCNRYAEIERSIKKVTPKTIVCTCGSRMNRVYSVPGVVFKGEGWPGQEIKRKSEDAQIFTRAKIARRMKASGQVPMEETIKAKDVDPAKFHGDLSKKELDEKRCDYKGLKKPAKKEKTNG